MTPVDRHANLRQARERAFGATLQLLTSCSAEYSVSSAELLSLLIEDLQNALHRPASPLSTSARSVASQAPRLYYSIVFRHTCKNQWVCPNFCDLCASNPNKRCEPESDLASKQLEEKEPLKTRCGALLQATVCCHEASQGELPNGVFALDDFDPQDFCIEMSIVSAQSVASLTEAGADLTVEAIRQNCELLTKKNTTHMQLLRKTSNSPEDSDNHRVRADFLPGKDHIGLDVRVTENSQRRLAATQKFQLLLVLLRKTDRQPVGYTLSNAFQVTTARAEVDWNADKPCWDSPVNKLDKCGTEITKNLLNVAECCESKGFVPPHQHINTVRTVQDFCYLCEDMGTWGPVPQVVINALVPEKAVKHSKKMLPRDYSMRIFMPKDCQHGAMYLCKQAHVDLANSATAVLLSCVITRGTIRMCLPERRSAEQNTLMSKLARQAEAAWQLPGHPGWYAAKCMEDSETLLDLFRQKEAENGGGLELSWHALANILSIDVCIFQPSMMHGGSPQLALPQGGAHWALPQTQQQPPQVPAGHLGAQQSPFVGTSNQAFNPCQGQQPPQVLQAWPDNTAGSGYLLPGDTLLPEAGQPGQFAAGPAAMAEADAFALPSHVTHEPPSASGNLSGPQGQPTEFDPFFSAQANIPSQFPPFDDAGPSMQPQRVPPLHSQDISSHAGSISPDEMRYTASASAHLGPVSPADSHLSFQSRSGHAQQSTNSTLALLQQQQHLLQQQQLQQQQQQQPFTSMRQDLQSAGQVPVGAGQTPGGPEAASFVSSGFPVNRGGREFSHTQSDRVRRQPPSRNPSFNDFRDAKRRSTAPAGLFDDSLLDDTLDKICNHPGGSEDSHLGSGALVAAPQQATFWPMGSNNSHSHSHSHSHQRQRGWAAQASPSSFHIDLPGLPSLVFADPVDRPIQQHTWVLPQYDGAGDLSSEDISFLDKDDVMSLLAAPGALRDDADSEQQQAGGHDEVEEIQPQVPYVVYVFLAKMRALVVRRRRHQLGAVAESLALDSCRKRMWQRAVIARFAKSGHAHAVQGARAASMDLSDLVGGSARDLWNEAGHQDDNHFLLDMAAEYFN